MGAEDAATSASSLLAASAVRDASASVTVSDTYVKKNSTTNYSAQSENWICNNSTYGVRYTLLKVENLPALASDCFVTKAYIYLRNTSAPTADTRFFTREILTDWDFSTVTYANIGETNIDFSESLFHMNIQFSKSVNYHVPIGTLGAGFLGGILHD